MTAPRTTDYTIKSIDNAVELLLLFERPPHRFGISELARALDMTRNQAFRIVKTLEERGFLTKHDRQYAIGPRLAGLVRHAGADYDSIRQAALPTMRKVTDVTGETSYLLVPVGHGKGQFIEVVESTAMIRSVPPLQEETPLNFGAAAKVLLTFLDPAERKLFFSEDLPQRTPFGLRQADLREQIRMIALRRYAVTKEEYAVGVDALGAPIWDHTGRVIAALGLVGPTSRLRARLQADLPTLLLESAREISARLSGDPDKLPDADLSDL